MILYELRSLKQILKFHGSEILAPKGYVLLTLKSTPVLSHKNLRHSSVVIPLSVGVFVKNTSQICGFLGGCGSLYARFLWRLLVRDK